MGVLISDQTTKRRENRLENAIIKILETEIPVKEFVATGAARLTEYINFRIEHLKKRYDGGEFNAYIRLTEIEALMDFIEKLGPGGRNGL